MNVSYMNSFRGYDLTIIDEQAVVAGVATPKSGLKSRLLVCTESSLLELRKSWGKTQIERAHNRVFFTDVSLKRSFGVWELEISTPNGELKYTGERDQLERVAQFLRQWGHEPDHRTETSSDSTDQHTGSEPNWQYASSASDSDAEKSKGWSKWQKGCLTVIFIGILLVVLIGMFSNCSDNNESTGTSDTQEATREARQDTNATAVTKLREARTATAAAASPTRAVPTRTPTPTPSPTPTPTFDELKADAVEIDYDDLFRNNETHVLKQVRLVAKIIQVISLPEKSDRFMLLANVTRDAFWWDDTVLLQYDGPRLLEDDIVEIVGIVLGLHTYEAVLGNEVTVPSIVVLASQRLVEVGGAMVTPTPKVVATPTPGPTATPAPTPTPSPTPEPPSTPAELVDRVQDSVVRVQARSGGTFFGTTARGSGFIFAVEGTTAFIATNQHIIDGKNSVEVRIGDSDTYEALVLGWDAERDVAVLSICCSSDFVALSWSSASPAEGTAVVAIGYPDSDTGTLIATIGEVLAPNELSTEQDFIPHSAPLNPGNSGGPLFAMPGGEVVGINTAGGTKTLAFYAVPYRAIESQVDRWRSQLVVGGSGQNVITDLTATATSVQTPVQTPVPTATATLAPTPVSKPELEPVIVASHDEVRLAFDDDELQLIANALGLQGTETLNVEPGIGFADFADGGIHHSGVYAIEFMPFDASFSGYKSIDSESPIRFFGRLDANNDENYSEPLQDLTDLFIQLGRLVTAVSTHDPSYLEINVSVPQDSSIKLEAVVYYTPKR